MSVSSYEVMIIIQPYFLSSKNLFESPDINYIRLQLNLSLKFLQ